MGNLYKKIILLVLLFLSTSLFASVAKVVAFTGEATITRDNKTLALTSDSKIFKKDNIQTKKQYKNSTSI